MKLLFETGPAFYAELNLRLFFKLLFTRCDAIHANDLDTLLPAYLVARIRGKQLVYDTHEYFTGVPELVKRPKVQRIWKAIERFVFPKLKKVVTVNRSIAELYEKEYKVPVGVMRNIPSAQPIASASRQELNLPLDAFILILQGNGINVDRGGEEAVQLMHHLDNALLLIAGSGDVIPTLKSYVATNGLSEKVRFLPRMPYADLMRYTSCCDLGLTLDKDTNINYRFSLPNKIFDYIHAGIPVLASNLPEVRRIVEGYDVGIICNSHNPAEIAQAVKVLLNHPDKKALFIQNCRKATSDLTWENEVQSIRSWY
jgi:glycosyltransferase involved in cell wall biosynthesis